MGEDHLIPQPHSQTIDKARQRYQLQDSGYDTVDANLMLGLPVDSRKYGIGAQIRVQLGVRHLRLITNNPLKYSGLGGYGIDIVERVPSRSFTTAENVKYLRTKRERMGHLLDDVRPAASSAPLDSLPHPGADSA